MMREWATVIAWNNGIATLRCNQKSGCSGCQARMTCGARIMNEVKPNDALEFKLPVEQYLEIGQKVELGISEANLLYSALLIYLVPLLGLFIGTGLCHWLIGNDVAVMIGALLGGIIGYFIAKVYARKLETKHFYQPIILQISLPTEIY